MYSYNPYYANYLAHYGTKEHSGRYPFGSGDRPYQHSPRKLKKFENKLNRWQTRKERQEQREKENQSQFDSATNPITRLASRFDRWIDLISGDLIVGLVRSFWRGGEVREYFKF